MTMPAPHVIFHALTDPDRQVMAALKAQLAPSKGQLSGPGTRPVYDTMMEQVLAAPDVTYQADTVGGVAGWWCRPAAVNLSQSSVLYLHGGAYVLGSAKAYRHFVGQLASRAGVEFFVADYRRAPEHPFPAAIDDALAAYQGLLALGRQRVALCGDSSGGGMALVLAALARDAAATQPGSVVPRAVAVLSPWNDLALASESVRTRAEADFYLTPELVATSAGLYLQGHDPHEVRASPVYGDLRGLPPLLVHVGDADLLLNDSTRYVDRARAAGVAAELHMWEGMDHVFETNVGRVQAAAQALDLTGEFLAGQLA